MKTLRLARPFAALALPLVVSATGCIESEPPTPALDVPHPGEQNPVDPTLPSEGDAVLRITGANGEAPVVGEDGLLHVEVRAANVHDLRTLGFDVVIEGATVREWAREDAFLRAAGGKLVALESRLQDDRLSIVVGTTAPVSSSREHGEVIAALTLAPTAPEVRVSLDTSGSMRGLLDASGARLEVTTQHARVAVEGE